MEQMLTALKSLRLSGMAAVLPMRLQEAKANDLDYLEFLERLIADELSRRKENLLNRRLKAARFPSLKVLDDFDFAFNPAISKKEIRDLASSRFIHQVQNVLFIGPPGVGKTHLAISLGISAIHNSYTVYYRSAFDLVEDMAEAYRLDHRKKLVEQFTRYQLLIIDEFGMKKMPPNAADDLLEIIHRRYGNAATIIATNRPIEDWSIILGDTAATSAILDRFLDSATVMRIKGKSFRMNKKKEN
jgi:DNA replication protein DnaC